MERFKTWEESVKVELEMRDVISKRFILFTKECLLSKREVQFLHTSQISPSIISKGVKTLFGDLRASEND